MSELKDVGVINPNENRIKGSLWEKNKLSKEQEAIAAHVEYLNNIVLPFTKEYGDFSRVLSGQTKLSMTPSYFLDFTSFRHIPDALYKGASSKLSISTPATKWNTGANLNELVEKYPLDRWKFYLSLNLQTPEQIKQSQSFFSELLKFSREKKLSLMTKPEDHNYDSCDIFTWQGLQMAEILKYLYHKYPDIWLPVHHFFQGPVDTIDSMHIGYVQEPIGGYPPIRIDGRLSSPSHSGRMKMIGDVLDKQGSGPISVETYLEGCAHAHFKPSTPWLIAA